MEKTPEQIEKENSSNAKFLYDREVGGIIDDLNAIKRKIKYSNSADKEEFRYDLTFIKNKYDKFLMGGNKSRYKKLKRRSNKTKKIKVKLFHSRRNKK
jgi:hypothetical protein